MGISRIRRLWRRPRTAALVLSTVLVASGLSVLLGTSTASADVTTNSADNLRTGWYANQPKLDPGTVESNNFGQLYSLNVTGQVYAQPLVSNNVLLVATEHNLVYGFNPSTQAQLWTKNLGTPVAPLVVPGKYNCQDINTEIGVTSTPVVDTATNTMYVMSSMSPAGSPAGSFETIFYLHALDVTTGAERAGYPVQIQGNADNDPSVSFNGTYQLQRPGLLLMNGVVYAAFSGHCDIGLYQGWIVGVSTATAKISAMWSDEVAPGANVADGPGAGIWMSGSGLVSDASGDIVFTTGNGTPPPTGPGTADNGALGQSQVRLRVQADGTLKAVDHFAPYDASVLNQTDSDVGSGGVIALPTQYFGTPAHPRLLVTIGKQGYVWLTDATNMGGVGQGPLGSDNVISRTGPLNGGVRGKPAVWGGDGGYVYIATSQAGSGTGRLIAFKYTLDGNGNPTLAQAGQSADLFGFGSGSPVVTSNGTGSGSALVWTTWFPASAADPTRPGLGAQLRAYDAVPVNGQMVLEKSYPISQGTKFAVPGVDDGRLYVGTNDGHVLAFGSPILAPLSGSTVTFPRTTVGASSTATATVTAGSALTVQSVAPNNPVFSVVSTTPALPVTLAAGDTMQVTLKFTPTAAGGSAAALGFTTSAGPSAVSLSATGQSAGPQLVQYPCCLSYGGVVTGSAKTETVTFSNEGAAPLIINSYDMPAAPFSVTGLPPAGSTIASGQSFAASFTFAPSDLGLFTDSLILHTNDPKALGFNGPNDTIAAGAVALSGTGGTRPAMRLTPQDINYGSVPIGTTATQTFTVTNTGGTDLNITISKTPGGQGFAARTSLPESSVIAAGQTVTERVDFTPTALGAASDSWAITGDDGGGRQDVNFHGSGTAPAAPSVSIADLDVNRPTTGSTVANVAVTLSQAATSPVTMKYSAKDGTATAGGGDFVATSGTLTFAPGETSKIIPVTINGAQPTPVAETFTVNLGTLSGATFADASAKLYLTNNYLPVSISVDDAVAPAAGNGATTNLAFPVTVSPAPYPGQPVTVKVATANGTAIAANGDYTPVNTTLTFTSDTPTQTVTVPLVHAPAAGTSRTVLLNLSAGSTGSNIGDNTATGTVYNGMAAPLPALYVSDPAVVRSTTQNVGATFTVRLSRSPSTQVPFTYSANAGSGMTAADFDFTRGNLTFLPGETSKTVTVPVHPSATGTGVGNINFNLSGQSGASLGDAGGKAYVVNPLLHPFLSVRPATAWVAPSEDTTVNVPVTLNAPAAVPVSVTVATVDGSALAGTDYAATSTTLTLAPGDTTAFLPVTVLHHEAVQPVRTFSVKLSSSSGVSQLSSSTALVTLVSHTVDATPAPQRSAPLFTAATPPGSAMVGSAYDYTFAAGGTPDPSFSVASGKLPTGLSLNALTGQLSGTPTTGGTFTFTVAANNNVGSPALTGALTITVAGPLFAPSFTAASPPNAAVESSSYSYTFAATANPAATFAVASGALPAGLGLDPATGLLSGAPTTPGTYGFVVSASNGVGSPALTGQLSIVVKPTPVAAQLTAASPNPDATVGTPYSYNFAASGNPNPTFTVYSGALPTGLALDPASGSLSGTPTAAGQFTFQVAAFNGVGGPAVSGPLTITVATQPAAPVFTAGAPGSSGVVGTAYTYTFAADGSPTPTFGIASGNTPPGLTLAGNGLLSGTPTVSGTFTFTVRAANSVGTATTGQLTITTSPAPQPPAFTSSTPPGTATVGTPYSYVFAATGNPAPSYSLSAGSSLPAGLSLNAATGELSGTPSAAGSFSFTVRADNGVGQAATAAATISVSAAPAPPVFTASTPPSSAAVGTAYSYVFAASGSPSPTFTVGSGSVPPGASLSSTGALTGTPTAAGTFTFTVTATNSLGSVTTGSISISVAPAPAAPQFTAASPPNRATVNAPYSYIFAATGVPAPTFGVNTGALPGGLSLDPVTGLLQGNPSTAGTFNFTVQAGNGIGTPAVSPPLTIIVAASTVADLITTITGPTTGKFNSTVTYNLNISNSGPSAAAQVVGSLTIPPGMTFVSASPAASPVNGQVTWSQASLSKGTAVHWKLTVQLTTRGSFTMLGNASSASADPTDNSVSLSTAVQ